VSHGGRRGAWTTRRRVTGGGRCRDSAVAVTRPFRAGTTAHNEERVETTHPQRGLEGKGNLSVGESVTKKKGTARGVHRRGPQKKTHEMRIAGAPRCPGRPVPYWGTGRRVIGPPPSYPTGTRSERNWVFNMCRKIDPAKSKTHDLLGKWALDRQRESEDASKYRTLVSDQKGS